MPCKPSLTVRTLLSIITLLLSLCSGLGTAADKAVRFFLWMAPGTSRDFVSRHATNCLHPQSSSARPGTLRPASLPGRGPLDSREIIANRVRRSSGVHQCHDCRCISPATQLLLVSHYIRPTLKQANALLKINKAQFGIAVWLNGKKIGEHFPCFTAAFFDLAPNIRWSAPNELLIRVIISPVSCLSQSPPAPTSKKIAGLPASTTMFPSCSVAIRSFQRSRSLLISIRAKSRFRLSFTITAAAL